MNYSVLFPHELAKYIYYWEFNSKNESNAIWLEPPYKFLDSPQTLEPISFFVYLGRMSPTEEESLSRTCCECLAESG